MSKRLSAKAFEAMDYGVYLVSTAADGKRNGCIVTSFSQVTSSYPPKFTLTLSKDHATTEAILASGVFSVTLLRDDCPESIINDFGYKSGRVGDKFAAYEPKTDESGCPYLSEYMVSRVSCKVVDKLEIGSYILLVGEATEAQTLEKGKLLTLSSFTSRGKPVPPTATVVREMKGKGFRCTVCGYIYESETLPEDYVCPICHAPASKFVAVE
jgi:flavin reductase (DIM6/NTAB) family NADH-FMN oxidoreductase RutF/rubredoxin